MDWTKEPWVKLYVKMTPEWMDLPWQARGLFDELMKVVDGRTGELQVGRLGLRGIALAVRADWTEAEPFIDALLEDGCVQFAADAGTVTIANFTLAQTSTSDAASRMRRYRERQHTRENPDGSAVEADPSSVKDRYASLREVTPVTTELKIKIKKEETPLKPPLGGSEPQNESRVGRPRATHIRDDYRPRPETIERFRGEGFDCEPHIEEFVNHWYNVAGSKGTKVDWDRTFVNRMKDLISWGKATPWRASVKPVEPKIPTLLTDDDRAAAAEYGAKLADTLSAIGKQMRPRFLQDMPIAGAARGAGRVSESGAAHEAYPGIRARPGANVADKP